jgi:hypothetical protein
MPARIMPWEWWRDLAVLASVPDGDRTVTRSSFCPSGCELDRHSAGDSRFIDVRRGEGVIFETDGAGALTRIWMVMGDGVSEPLDPSIRLRVRVDGRRTPVVDLPLPEVFSGRTPPFLAPLVLHRTGSGGGNVSYVPIPFRDGCSVSLVGADDAKIWFQVTARLVAEPGGVRSFSGEDPVEGMRSMLERAGSDPWVGGPFPTTSGVAVLPPGGGEVVATLEGPDLINGLMLRVNRKHWHRLGLRLTFDDQPARLVTLLDLFGVTDVDGGPPRSLLFGADEQGDLYCYFPMPYFDRAVVELLRRPVEGPARVRVEYALRTAGRPPPPDAGVFHLQSRRHDGSSERRAIPWLDLSGRGALVGLALGLSPKSGRGWGFLEGDERIRIDGEPTPSWHGTGVEDLFNGGFYFRNPELKPTSFATAIAGAPAIRRQSPRVGMYRLFLGDAVVFSSSIQAELETGPTGEIPVRGRSIAFAYLRPDAGKTGDDAGAK